MALGDDAHCAMLINIFGKNFYHSVYINKAYKYKSIRDDLLTYRYLRCLRS